MKSSFKSISQFPTILSSPSFVPTGLEDDLLIVFFSSNYLHTFSFNLSHEKEKKIKAV